MRAAVHHSYGPPAVISVEDRPAPVPGPTDVLIRVRAAAVNPLDWHELRGSPKLMRIQGGLRAPKEIRLGQDIAGTVEAVGPEVTRFAVGDEVFGSCIGAYAELAVAGQDNVVLVPSGVDPIEASGVGVAGLTALQGLRDHCQVSTGQRVLVNGASGGVGHFAVQLAKIMGAHVTGVCSTRNVELVASLGADEVIDYTTEDFTRASEPYDVVFDLAANRSHRELRRITTPKGVISVAGASPEHPIGHIVAGLALSPFIGQKLPVFVAKWSGPDLEQMAGFLADGSVRVEVSRTFPLEETAAAIAHLEEGHARGKVVVVVREP